MSPVPDRLMHGGLPAAEQLALMPHREPIEGVTTQDPLAGKDSARAVVLIMHPDEASRRHPGHAFVADVLRANGLAVLSLVLPAAPEAAGAGPAPDMSQATACLDSLIHGWMRRQSRRGRPVALIGVDGAIPACAALAQGTGPFAPQSLVLFDARPEPAALALVGLQAPALHIVGICDARWRAQQCAARCAGPSSDAVGMLPHAKRPALAPGTFEALARAALSWFARTLPAPAGRAGDAGALMPPTLGEGHPRRRPAGGKAPAR